jgi:histidinol-phosphate aminotransferase
LPRQNEFALDADSVIAACKPDTKLVFICSPNNPTGSIVPRDDILRIAEARHGKSLVVVDEAYIEFAALDSMVDAISRHENLVVLRTLSKAQALAGARCGAAIAHAATIDVLCRVLPPYSFPTPVVECVLRALSADQMKASKRFIAEIVSQRERLFATLGELEIVRTVWPSFANFLLVELEDAAAVYRYLFDKNILIRNVADQPELDNCIRITIGTREENDALLTALRAYGKVN